jgi:hypothetical protein
MRPGKETAEENGYTRLVRCANDLEFRIIRRGVVLGRDVCGPYYGDWEYVGIDFNEDDEDGLGGYC